MSTLSFEWDPKKEAANRQKHGVSFFQAATVFQDELARLILDPDHSEHEERLILMGMSSDQKVLVVHHCERYADVIRIFSARKATRAERRQYEEFLGA